MWPRRNKIERCTGGHIFVVSREDVQRSLERLVVAFAHLVNTALTSVALPLVIQPRNQETFRGIQIIKASVTDQNLMT